MKLQAWEYKFLAIMSKQFSKSNHDSSHDMSHVHRVLKLAKYIHSKEGGSLEIIVPAAILHDYISVEKNSPQRSKASLLASQAVKTLLARLEYPEQYHEGVCHAIEAHSFSANVEPWTLEAKIVQDADRLDSLGAIGVARVFSVGQRMGSYFYNSEDPLAEKDRELNDRNSTIDHFYTKLFKLAPLLKTQTAQALAEDRVTFMKSYMQQLKSELEVNF